MEGEGGERETERESGGGVPYLHKDFVFTESTRFKMSTSQLRERGRVGGEGERDRDRERQRQRQRWQARETESGGDVPDFIENARFKLSTNQVRERGRVGEGERERRGGRERERLVVVYWTYTDFSFTESMRERGGREGGGGERDRERHRQRHTERVTEMACVFTSSLCVCVCVCVCVCECAKKINFYSSYQVSCIFL